MPKLLPLLALAAILIPTIAEGADRIDAYPLDTCAVATKSKLGGMGDPVVKVIDGREFRLCCERCVAKLEADPAKFAASVDARIIEAQKASYPLTTCVVSGEPLDADAVDFVVGNTLLRTCCKNCVRKVQSKPENYLAKLDEAIVAAQAKEYPLTTCAVSGEALEGKSIDVIVGNRLVRLCCKGCKKGVSKDPAAVLAAVEAGWSAKSKGAEKKGAPEKAGLEKAGLKKAGLKKAEPPQKSG